MRKMNELKITAKRKMKFETIKQIIPISDFLHHLGIEPVRVSGAEAFYHAPYRKDSTPSLTVNDRSGLWYDHGSGKGGSILDLAKVLFETRDIHQAALRIQETCHIRGDAVLPDFQQKDHAEIPRIVRSYQINQVKSLGSNPAISDYLEQRGILSEALRSHVVKEVYYQVENEKGERKRFFGAGWFNESDGVDIRSKYGKICLFKKDICILPGNSGRINVFEGMMDFLSALKERRVQLKDKNIILNSVALSRKAILGLSGSNPQAIRLFLDHDRSGDDHTRKFREAFPGSLDCRIFYQGYSDYNEKIQDMLLPRRKASPVH